ncbi:hypothetical protein RHSIM_Rhsim10G0127700 [Rhododendron simsii]|uniref:Uncharacterized protein n=1 Tax=Rhododendron simsii TaxID=118357 RepID=A0A834GF48_RHOSS|nr:hypothetical protein RHSIM_Rhsim10G0127700 [Rhododendron simsii]
MAFSVSTAPWHPSVSHFRPKHFPSSSSISSPTKITLRLALCHAAKKQGGPPVRTNTKKKKKKKLGGGGGRRDGARGLSLDDVEYEDDDDDNDDGEWGASSRKIITPPAGFVVDDDDKVLMVSDKRILSFIVDSNNLPLECIIRRVFRSAQGEESMLLCPADMPVRIVKSKNMEGLSSVSVEEVKGLLPTVAYALAKVHMHLVHSGLAYVNSHFPSLLSLAPKKPQPNPIGISKDGEDADGLPNEGIEITSFNVDGSHYMIYTPSDPLLMVAVKDQNGHLKIVDEVLHSGGGTISQLVRHVNGNAKVYRDEYMGRNGGGGRIF